MVFYSNTENQMNMKRSLYTLLTALTFTVGTSYSQEFSWARSMGSFSVDRAQTVVTDPQGNVYSAGIFSSTGDFDPGNDVTNLSSAGNYDIFIQKLNPAGELIWVKQIGGIMDDVPYGMELDSDGNIFITGYFSDQVDFDPGAGSTVLTTAGNYDAFILKLDPSGNFVWGKKIGSTLGDYAHDLTIDETGNVYVTGIFGGTVDFDPGAGTSNLTSVNNNSYESFILKLTNSGDFTWVAHLGGSEDEYARAISTDDAGNVYTTGYFYGVVDFDPGAGTDNHTSAGGADIFIQKLSSAGDLVWAHTMGSINNDYCQGIDANVDGAVYLFGTFAETVDFDPESATLSLTPVGQADIFLLKLSDSGALTWVKQIGSQNQDFARALVTHDSGDVYLTGNIYEAIDLDPGPGVAMFSSMAEGTAAIFAEKLSASGDYEWAGVIAPNNNCYATDITLSQEGYVYMVGSYTGTADFDPGTGVTQLTGQANQDAYVVKWGGTVAGLSETLLPQLQVWPNPTTGLLSIDLGAYTPHIDIELTDISGSLIRKETFYNTSEVKMNLTDNPGLYFVRVKNASGEQLIKVVKN
jgi:hypothetical protein